jgi:hypothetical protein
VSRLRGRWLPFEDHIDPGAHPHGGAGMPGPGVPGVWRQATITQTITGGTLSAPGMDGSDYPGGPGYRGAGWNTAPTDLRAVLTILLLLAATFVRLLFWAAVSVLIVLVTVKVGRWIA